MVGRTVDVGCATVKQKIERVRGKLAASAVAAVAANRFNDNERMPLLCFLIDINSPSHPKKKGEAAIVQNVLPITYSLPSSLPPSTPYNWREDRIL